MTASPQGPAERSSLEVPSLLHEHPRPRTPSARPPCGGCSAVRRDRVRRSTRYVPGQSERPDNPATGIDPSLRADLRLGLCRVTLRRPGRQVDHPTTRSLPQRASARCEPSPRRPRCLPRPRGWRPHLVALPKLRYRGVRAAAYYALPRYSIGLQRCGSPAATASFPAGRSNPG